MLNSTNWLIAISRFLLVCLGIDEILAATTIRQKRQALDRMASGLGLQDAYNTTLDRIRQQGGGKSKLGMAVLMWVSRCERPLLWEELRHALGVDLKGKGFTTDNVPSIQTVLGCTLGLVTIIEYGSTVRLLHLTLQEYLGASPTVFETPQSMMAEICLTYLNSPSVRAQRDIGKAREESPFLEYATRFWGTHAAREVTEEVKSRALLFLDGYESHISATILLRERRWWRWPGQEVCGVSGLHCIAFWGIVEIAIAMLKKKKWDVNGRDSWGDTPLMWAVRYRHSRVVELLLEQGDIKPDVIGWDGRTALSFAAELGNENAVKLLLEHGVNPNSLDSRGRAPLSYAAAGRHEGVVRLLVESRDIDPNSSDSYGLTPLSYAARWGREDLIKRLLEQGVNSDLPDSYGRTPLLFAVLGGHEGAVKLLLGRVGVNPNLPASPGLTPLSRATILHDDGIVKLLREYENVNHYSPDPSGPTPQSFSPISAAGGVGLLLERADANLWFGVGGILLLFAAQVGDKALVRRLLGRGDIDHNFPDSNLQTPLSLAITRGHEGIVKLLLECKEVNCNSRDDNGQTPLHIAALGRHYSAVKLLLERSDIDVNCVDRSGRTALSCAAGEGHVEVVRLLIEDPTDLP